MNGYGTVKHLLAWTVTIVLTAAVSDGAPPTAPAALPATASFHWHYPKDQQGAADETVVAACVAVAGNSVLVPLAGELGRRGISCLPADLRAVDAPAPRWVYKTKNEVRLAPAVHGPLALVVDGRTDDKDRLLRAIGMEDGKRKWQVPIAPDASGCFAVAPGCVLVEAAKGRLDACDLAAKQLWSAVCLPSRAGVTVVAGCAVVAEGPSALVAFDLATGKSRWRLEVGKLCGPAAAWKDQLYVATVEGVRAERIGDGKTSLSWQKRGDAPAGPLAVNDQWVAFVNAKSELVVLHRNDGKPACRQTGAMAVVTPLLDSRAVVFAVEGQLQRLALDAEGAQPSSWIDLSWLGRPVTGVVRHGPNFYLGIVGWGLVRLGPPDP